jgi:hypothetical protein
MGQPHALFHLPQAVFFANIPKDVLSFFRSSDNIVEETALLLAVSIMHFKTTKEERQWE